MYVCQKMQIELTYSLDLTNKGLIASLSFTDWFIPLLLQHSNITFAIKIKNNQVVFSECGIWMPKQEMKRSFNEKQNDN